MKNGAKWLSAIGVVGVAVTAILSGIATRKAVKKLDELKTDAVAESLDKKTIVKSVGKYYIPPVLSFLATTACILGAEKTNAKAIASATATAALLKRSYDKYGQAVKNVFGIEGDKRVKEEMARSNGESPPEEEETYYIGFGYDGYFRAKPSDIERAEYIMNKKLRQCQPVSVADFFDIVGIEPNAICSGWGWSRYELFSIMDDGWLTIELHLIEGDNGEQVYMVDFDCKPTEDFETHHKWYEPDATDRQVPWDE